MGKVIVRNQTELDALTFPGGTYGYYGFTGYDGSNIESNDGLLLVFYHFMLKYGSDGKMAFRNTSNTTWHYVGYDIPTFYKNYNSLAELKAALGTI